MPRALAARKVNHLETEGVLSLSDRGTTSVRRQEDNGARLSVLAPPVCCFRPRHVVEPPWLESEYVTEEIR